MRLEQLEKYLLHWADWQGKQAQQGLGYPSCAAIAFFLPAGKVGTPRVLPVDQAAEAMEGWITEMGQFQPPLRLVLCAHYLDPRFTPHKARALGISAPQFKQQLRLARYWLVGRMSAEGRLPIL